MALLDILRQAAALTTAWAHIETVIMASDARDALVKLDTASALYDALQDTIPILVWAESKHVTGAREALGAARAAIASADGGEQ